jgi:hypothetical protein
MAGRGFLLVQMPFVATQSCWSINFEKGISIGIFATQGKQFVYDRRSYPEINGLQSLNVWLQCGYQAFLFGGKVCQAFL